MANHSAMTPRVKRIAGKLEPESTLPITLRHATTLQQSVFVRHSLTYGMRATGANPRSCC